MSQNCHSFVISYSNLLSSAELWQCLPEDSAILHRSVILMPSGMKKGMEAFPYVKRSRQSLLAGVLLIFFFIVIAYDVAEDLPDIRWLVCCRELAFYLSVSVLLLYMVLVRVSLILSRAGKSGALSASFQLLN